MASGRSETPTMATDRGFISLPRERLMRLVWRAGRPPQARQMIDSIGPAATLGGSAPRCRAGPGRSLRDDADFGRQGPVVGDLGVDDLGEVGRAAAAEQQAALLERGAGFRQTHDV